MHKSRINGFTIDCRTTGQTDDLDQAAQFWSAALGYELAEEQTEKDYRLLKAERDHLHIELQRVSHESRVHLDIETDDLEAEVARLEKLGAKRIEFVKRWWVMEAPTGHRFCVVRPKQAEFAELAREWP